LTTPPKNAQAASSHGRHPARPPLVVEATLTRHAFDREYKSSLYSRAAIADYWIVNLVLEVGRRPMASDAAPYGWTYEALTVLRPGASVTTLAAPFVAILVADLLP